MKIHELESLNCKEIAGVKQKSPGARKSSFNCVLKMYRDILVLLKFLHLASC